MNQIRIRTGVRALACALLTLHAPALAVEPLPEDPIFASQPGVRELSRRLIVRPWDPEHWMAQGLTHAEAKARAAQAEQRIAPNLITFFPEVGEFVVAVPEGLTDGEFALQLAGTDDYQYIEPDWLVSALALPNDPLVSGQWHHVAIDSPAAWDLVQGDPSVIIAICDSGIDVDHPDLSGALVPGFNAVDDLPQAMGGQVDGLTDHGTQVAGCAGAIGNNGVGVSGVGWRLSLMPIRVRNVPDDTALLSDIHQGARWAVDNGAKVVNVSFTGATTDAAQTTAAYIRSRGGLYVWAAGNSASNVGADRYPDLTLVGATDRFDQLAVFSNYGDAVDLVAPGDDILTTGLGTFNTNSGTSFASPIAAGALGVIWSANPALSNSAAQTILLESARDLGEPGDDDRFGAGIVSLRSAVDLATQAATTNLPPIARDDRASGLVGVDNVIDVLLNDADINGDEIVIDSFDSVSVEGGLVERVNLAPAPDKLRYTPPPGFRGFDSFEYQIRDPGGLTARATVTVGVAKAPQFGEPIEVQVSGVTEAYRFVQPADLTGNGRLEIVAGGMDRTGDVVIVADAGGGIVSQASRFTVPFAPDRADAADIDHDGDDDIAMVAPASSALQIGRPQGLAGFAFETYVIPNIGGFASGDDIAASKAVRLTDSFGDPLDLNRDGHTDVVAIEASILGGSYLHVRFNNSAGAFTTGSRLPARISPWNVNAADMDGDTITDLVTGNVGTTSVSIFFGQGDGRFDPSIEFPAPGGGPHDVALADFDGDGDTDVATLKNGALSTGVVVATMLNDGVGFLSTGAVVAPFASSAFARRIEAADVNRDGRPDLVVQLLSALTTDPDLAILLNIGDGTFVREPVYLTSPGALARSMSAADFDGNGATDLITSTYTSIGRIGRVVIHPNITPGPCVCDADVDGDADVFDLLAYLSGWFAGDAAADLAAPAGIDVFDLLAFLDCWFAGCG